MLPAFRQLAKLKSLRGSTFDLFGYGKERRKERALIDEYKAMVRQILGKLQSENLQIATSLASLPQDIRGFGPVKDAAIAQVEEKKKELLEQFGTADQSKTDPGVSQKEPAE